MTYIDIPTPQQITSKRVQKQVEEALKSGLKCSEIICRMQFFTMDTQELFQKFHVLKNQIAFKLDKETPLNFTKDETNKNQNIKVLPKIPLM